MYGVYGGWGSDFYANYQFGLSALYAILFPSLCIVFSFDVVHEQLIYSPDNCVVYMEKRALLCFAHRRHIYTEFISKKIRVHHMAAYKFDDRVLYPCNPSNSVPTASQHIYAYTGIVNGMRSRTLSSWRVAEVTRHIR